MSCTGDVQEGSGAYVYKCCISMEVLTHVKIPVCMAVLVCGGTMVCGGAHVMYWVGEAWLGQTLHGH